MAFLIYADFIYSSVANAILCIIVLGFYHFLHAYIYIGISIMFLIEGKKVAKTLSKGLSVAKKLKGKKNKD